MQLPNRLGKMLSPLHWHDYKKKYGRLDDFVASHPEVRPVEASVRYFYIFIRMCFFHYLKILFWDFSYL